MLLDFNTIEAKSMPAMKGGVGVAAVQKFDDPRMGGIVHISLPAGASIGLHTHSGNCEVVYVLSGRGRCLDDGTDYALIAGMCHYCPEGHSHSIINDAGDPLELLAVLPKVQ